ncbi:RecQ family ATP-dependent DNA helicase [Gemmatimonas phototrophica]|uniref:RecQ family ATP-dependent DNA helicase n=1 Tax=Gemmatimonas phototrophica TaxID=1379270 RepID=UPI0006A6DDE0|nr:ATP-dependent DNA helicase RecQ [Gemmatimonas phototrophica]
MPPYALPDRSLGALSDARRVLREQFGYPDFRPPQIRAVQAVLSGRDALVVLPTGGGKSLCYQVPALVRAGLTIVISPLISLMKDQVETLRRKGVASAYINSTLSRSDVADRLAEAREGRLKLLYLSPERAEAGRMVQQLSRIGVALFAVDEAHCISEWGHDFRPSYRRIAQVREQLGNPQTVALTATATPSVREDIMRQLTLSDPAIVVAGFDRTNLTYHVVPARTPPDKDRLAIQWLHEASGPAVVYAPTRKAVERLASLLVRGRIKATAYHAGLDATLRQRAQDAFMEERARVIVATSAFGMGIDKPDVRLVVHHAMPGAIESYYQEAGRAGRDGNPSTCVLLHHHTDRSTHDFFLDSANPARRLVEDAWSALRRAADGTRFVAASAEGLARSMAGCPGERQVAAALRVLIGSGACTAAPTLPGRVWIRLLASPARIGRELQGSRDHDREVLRSLWRATRGGLATGVTVDLEGLPPGFGGTTGLVPVLERLEAQQFVTWNRSGAGFHLAAAAVDPSWLPVDWSALERRRRTETARLDAMQHYAQTRHCRRAYILRYFGDPDAREHCGACDRCLGPAGSVRALRTPRALRSRSRPRS